MGQKILKNQLLMMDLDNTLIDTVSFKNDLFNTLSQDTGLSYKEVQHTYESIKSYPSVEGWVLRLIRKLSTKTSVTEKNLKRSVFKCVDRIRIYNKTVNFIQKFTGKKFLLTYGDRQFQKKKLDALGLNILFDKVIITDEDKACYVKKLINRDALRIDNDIFTDIIVVDDRQNFLNSLKNYKWIKTLNSDIFKKV